MRKTRTLCELQRANYTETSPLSASFGRPAVHESKMAKTACIFGLIVALALLAVFALDMFMKMPFSGFSKPMDIGFMVSALLLAYVSFRTFRELP